MRKLLFILSLLLFFSVVTQAQENASIGITPPPPMYAIYEGDTVPIFNLRPIHIFPIKKFKNNKEREQYTKLVRDVKKTYPYARMISYSIIETYEYMQTLPDDKSKQKHLEEVQKYMMKTYKPEMKKMTKNQGKILVKLIDRQCNTSSYSIVKSLVGDLKAGFYNTFAGLFGNNLKSRYEPNGRDSDIESIVLQIEDGTIDYYYYLNSK